MNSVTKIIRSVEESNELKEKEEPKAKKKKGKMAEKIAEAAEEYDRKKLESKESTRNIVRDSVSQGIAELKVKKMSGEVLTASIGDIIKMKQEENIKK